MTDMQMTVEPEESDPFYLGLEEIDGQDTRMLAVEPRNGDLIEIPTQDLLPTPS